MPHYIKSIVRYLTLLAVSSLVSRLAKTGVITIVTNTGGAILTRFARFAWVYYKKEKSNLIYLINS